MGRTKFSSSVSRHPRPAMFAMAGRRTADAEPAAADGGSWRRPDMAPPWETHAPDAPCETAFLMRVSEYERELLRYVSQAEERSMHVTARRLLIPALERLAREIAAHFERADTETE